MILVCTKAEYLSPQQLPPGSSPVCGLHLVHAEYERAPHVQGPRLWPHTTPGGGRVQAVFCNKGAPMAMRTRPPRGRASFVTWLPSSSCWWKVSTARGFYPATHPPNPWPSPLQGRREQVTGSSIVKSKPQSSGPPKAEAAKPRSNLRHLIIVEIDQIWPFNRYL